MPFSQSSVRSSRTVEKDTFLKEVLSLCRWDGSKPTTPDRLCDQVEQTFVIGSV